MPTVVPNEGELLLLIFGLGGLPAKAGLYRNNVSLDGNTNYYLFEQLKTGGGRNYAEKSIDNAMNLTGLITGQYYVYTDSYGRAMATYCENSANESNIIWTFNSTDAGDGYSVKGYFMYSLVLPFDGGEVEIKVGDTVTGGTSGATAKVAAIKVFSGDWSTDDAAGWMVVKDQTGTFINDEDLQVGGVTAAVSNTGTSFGGDTHKRVILAGSFTSAITVSVDTPIKVKASIQLYS